MTLNASALRDPDGKVIGAIGILRDMREYEQVVRDLEKSKSELQEKILDLEKFEEVVVGRELKMIAPRKGVGELAERVRKTEGGALMPTPAIVTPDPTAASRFRAQVETLERRLRERDEQRRAMVQIMGDLTSPTSAWPTSESHAPHPGRL